MDNAEDQSRLTQDFLSKDPKLSSIMAAASAR
jgi:hypothetical protein